MARVLRAWTAPESPVAIGDGLAPITPWRCVDALDGTRRRERAGGDRDGQAPHTDTARAQTHGTRGVVGGHPATALGRPSLGIPRLARCHRSGCPLPLPLLPQSDVSVRGGAGRAVADGTGTSHSGWRLH